MTDFEQLVREHAGTVRSLVYHILRSSNDVEDVTQEVFLKVYQSIDAYRGGSFRAYILRIARNHCYDILRKQRSRKAITQAEPLDESLVSTGQTPEQAVLAAEFSSDIQAALRAMSEVDREIMLMKHVYGFGYDEIADAMKMRPGAVRTRLSRARQRLMSNMQGREYGEASDIR